MDGLITMIGECRVGECVLDAQTQNGDEPVGEYSYPRVKLPF